jgi:hypothetical protein
MPSGFPFTMANAKEKTGTPNPRHKLESQNNSQHNSQTIGCGETKKNYNFNSN